MRKLAFALSLSLLSSPAVADDTYFEFSGFIAGETRFFPRDAIQAGQDDQHINPSLIIQPEMLYEWAGGDERIEFTPFLRLDANDSERTHADIRELKYLRIGDGWDLQVGFDKIFWGVIESRHLVDIINQTDAVESVDGEDKLGQPMINLGLQPDWGNLNFIVMPYFRQQTFAGVDGRLRSSTPIDNDRAEYASDMGRFHPDVALRYSTVLGDWDVGAYHFRGTGREPTFLVGQNKEGATVLVPKYEVINQSGLDVQATFDAWLWKLEALHRSGQGNRFSAASAGLEYTFFGVIGEAGDLGVLAEYHYDGRDSTNPGTLFDDDIFLGGRITLNDENDTDFLAGILVDRITHSVSFSAEADRRLSDNWTAEAELRISGKQETRDVTYDSRADHHLLLRLTRYF